MSYTGLPPPRQSREFRRISRPLPQTTLELLIDMGFSRQLSEKVIAAVGDKDIHTAVDWLMSHIEDPTLKENLPRDYFVYLCPMGDFRKCLDEFWQKSETVCGWSGVHSFFPHITMCPVFQVEDERTSKVCEIFSSLDITPQQPINCKLEHYSANNFIGLFVPDAYHSFLEKIMSQFALHLSKIGINMEPHKRQLHMTLAYNFPPQDFDKWNDLSRAIRLDVDVRWELRLYSRDQRLAQSQVYKVLSNFTASSSAEMDLVEGDYVYVENSRVAESADGWFYGTSWLTGCSGLFPTIFCKRTSEMWTWTLHKCLVLQPYELNNLEVKHESASETDIIALYSKVKRRKSAPMLPPRQRSGPRRVYIMRHGERIDFVFGKDWTNCFDKSGNYSRLDLNTPLTLPRRRQNVNYVADCPLTELGLVQAYKTGEALAKSGVSFDYVYSSPSFRCIQTTSEVIKGMNTDSLIRIDPVLFEWLQWYPGGLPGWMSIDELSAYSYPVDLDYAALYDNRKLSRCLGESIPDYYQRSHDFIHHVLSQNKRPGVNILVVGHAATVDVCMRRMRGYECCSGREFHDFVSKVPFCALVMYEEDSLSKTWTLQPSPIQSFTNSSNRGMFWRSDIYL